MVNLQSQNGLITNGPRSFAHPTSKTSPTATISHLRFGQPFEASRDIHTIAKDVIVLDDVVTLVDADGNSMRLVAETVARPRASAKSSHAQLWPNNSIRL